MIEELYLLDKERNELCTLTDFICCIWHRKSYEAGSIQLFIADSKENFSIAKQVLYIARNDSDEYAVIRSYGIDKDRHAVYISGGLGECRLNDEVSYPVAKKTAVQSELIKYLFRNYYSQNHADVSLSKNYPTCGSSLVLENTGDYIGDLMYSIGKTNRIRPGMLYNYLNDSMYFTAIQGMDHSLSQSENNPVVFSSFEMNAEIPGYDHSKEDYKNFAIVAGTGEGSARIRVDVDVRTDASEERRVLFVNASDLQKDDAETETAYKARLTARGKEKLSECLVAENLEMKAGYNAGYIYRGDYDVGDMVSVNDEDHGIYADTEITEAIETYESGEKTVEIVFGNQKMSSIERIRKEVY